MSEGDYGLAEALRSAARADAMRRARQAQEAGAEEQQDPEHPEYAPYAPQGGFIDWISSILPDWLSGRSAVMQNRQRMAQMDEQTEE